MTSVPSDFGPVGLEEMFSPENSRPDDAMSVNQWRRLRKMFNWPVNALILSRTDPQITARTFILDNFFDYRQVCPLFNDCRSGDNCKAEFVAGLCPHLGAPRKLCRSHDRCGSGAWCRLDIPRGVAELCPFDTSEELGDLCPTIHHWAGTFLHVSKRPLPAT